MGDKLPEAVYSATLTIMGVEIGVHVLDDGRRILEADGVNALFEAMGRGEPMTEDDAVKFVKAVRP